eukprot:TRINITY_DN3121_c0_g1_i1.p1 TRINITY_DN3121_c0_g1~~TRINITY_DN3121_c0_g1_i1.p1  ORF type:complete len:976 (+),score=158.64 TRINITY_DN3121_c0_g1_i1:108-3035(+)
MMRFRSRRFLLLGLFPLVLFTFSAFVHSTPTAPKTTHSCTSSQYFDTAALICRDCPTNQESDPDLDGLACRCVKWSSTTSLAYRKVVGSDGSSFTCTACASSSYVVSRDGETCMTCSGTIANGECVCGANEIVVESNAAGVLLGSKTCLECPTDSYVSSSDLYTCAKCPDPNRMTRTAGVSCVCPTGFTTHRGSCVYSTYASNVPTSGASTVSYGSGTVISDVFEQLYLPSAVRCKYESNVTACQILANLCVLQLYETSKPACSIYRDAIGTKGQNGVPSWPMGGVPFLYYSGGEDDVVKDKDLIQKTMKLGDDLTFYLAEYQLDGSFLGFSKIGSELQLCPKKPQDAALFLDVGSNMINKCFFVAANILEYSETRFYEMYFLDSDGILKGVPVVLSDYSSSSYVNRFFMYDNIAGKTAASSTPEIIRFAETVELRYLVQSEDYSKIYAPLLTIKYTDMKSSGLSAPTENFNNVTTLTKKSGTTEVTFTSVFTMDWADFLLRLTVSVIVLGLLALGIWVFRMFVFARLRQNSTIDVEFLINAFLTLISILSDAFFMLIWLMALFIFLFYKFQPTITVLLPEEGDRTLFLVLMIICLSGKFLYMIIILWYQSHYDIFFVDWEKSRGRLLSKKPDKKGQMAPVSVWRTLFVCNEWNEIQTVRWTDLEFTLLVLFLLWHGFGLIYLAKPQPGTEDLEMGDTDPLLRFALTTTTWIAFAVFQIVSKKAFIYRFLSHPIGDFVDLCSIANVSVLILQEPTHGFYIHGRSAHSHADATMMELRNNLAKEEEGLVSTRGMMPDSDVQTFEVFATAAVREEVNTKLLVPIARNIAAVQNAPRVRGDRQKQSLLPPKEIVRGYHAVNRYLQNLVDSIQTNPDQVREKTFWQKAFGTPPDVQAAQKDFFFYDETMGFRKVLFHGVEHHLLFFNILVFSIIDYFLDNTFAAGCIVYVLENMLKGVRSWLGKRNITMKTLIDGRFFI